MKRIFSQMDLFCATLVIRGAWIYDSFMDFKVLSKGLSELVKEYPLLTGRMDPDKKGLEYPAFQAIPFTEIKNSSLSVKDLQQNEDFASGKMYGAFAPGFSLRDFQKGKVPPFAASLTQLADGSLLTVQLAHVLMDGHAFYRMMARWGEICRGILSGSKGVGEAGCSASEGALESALEGASYCAGPGAILDQSIAPGQSGSSKEQTLERVQRSGWIHLNGKKVLQMMLGMFSGASKKYVRVLHVSAEEIGRMKKEAGEGVGTNAVLAAYVVKGLMKSGAGEYTIMNVADLRGRWKSLPEEFVGNTTGNIVTGGLRCSDTFGELAGKIQSNIDSYFSDSQKLEEIVSLYLDASYHKLPYINFDVADMYSRKPHTLNINNLLRFRLYDTDFGRGRPLLTPPNDLPDMVKFWPNPSGDGSVDIILRGYPARLF